jgi:hypothetical protein
MDPKECIYIANNKMLLDINFQKAIFQLVLGSQNTPFEIYVNEFRYF